MPFIPFLKETKDVCSQEHPGYSTLYPSYLPATWELSRHKTSPTKHVYTYRTASPHTELYKQFNRGAREYGKDPHGDILKVK